MTTIDKMICAAKTVAWLAAVAGVLWLFTRGSGTPICLTVSAGGLAAVLGAIWFVTYGIGTTWQMVHERPYQNQVRQAQQLPQLPLFTCWTIVTQAFAQGTGAAAGWLAAWMLWVLWTDEQSRASFNLGHVALFGIALLGVTGWLPRRVMEVFGGR